MLFGGKCLRLFPDAPLALLIGILAKRAKETGAPSLKHPFARVFAADDPTSPLANSRCGHQGIPLIEEQTCTGLLVRQTHRRGRRAHWRVRFFQQNIRQSSAAQGDFRDIPEIGFS
jgi:hypothetical protein